MTVNGRESTDAQVCLKNKYTKFKDPHNVSNINAKHTIQEKKRKKMF